MMLKPEHWDIYQCNPIKCVDGPYRSKGAAMDRSEELTQQTGRTHVHVLQGSLFEKRMQEKLAK